MKKALMTASVASMIDSFNRNNISILQDLGYEVHVACNFQNGNSTSQDLINSFHDELEDMGVTVYQVNIPRSIFAVKQIIRSYLKIKDICKKNKYEIVHCHTPIGSVITRLACRKFRKTGTKVIYTAHGFHFYKGAPIKNWMIFYPIEKFLARYTDILITINKEDYHRAQNFRAKEVKYIPGVGVDLKKYNNNVNENNRIRKQLSIPDDSIVLISVGELIKRKNHEIVIEALAKLKNKKIVYLICGQGLLYDQLKKRAEELDVNVRFLGYRSDVNNLLTGADVFVFPSLQEGLPVALMEAMAVGLPVICSDIRGNNDLIENKKGGYLFQPNNVDNLVELMDDMIYNQDICHSMGDFNKNKIKNYECTIVNKKMMKIYKEFGLE